MKIRLLLLLFFYILLPSVLLQAQVTIGSGIPANTGSLLDLKEYNPDADNITAKSGLLLPRVLLNTTIDFEPIFSGASGDDKLEHTGLMVYHIGNPNLCSGAYVWTGLEWVQLPEPCRIETICRSVVLNGIYKVGQTLTASNTITLTIEVPTSAVGGTYNIYTDTQNGMTFSGTGTMVKGTQTITLNGIGAPASGGFTTEFGLHVEYSNSPSSSIVCSARIPEELIPIAKPKIFGFGSNTGTYGYHLESSGSRAFLLSPNNFGATGTAKVNSDGFDIVTAPFSSLTVPNFINSPTAGIGINPDIMINGFETNTVSTPVIDELVIYLERGGVLILMDEYGDLSNNTSITLQLLKRLFPIQASGISFKHLGAESSVYGMTTAVDDEITNGPFGDVRGTYWGEDASATSGFAGLPLDSITVYSNGDVLGGSITNSTAPKLNPGYVTMFKHNRLNLFFVGDGGFNSNYLTNIGPTYLTYYQYCPFAIDAGYRPIPRTNWGLYGPIGGGKFTVHNSLIFANVMYWAMRKAPSNNK